MLAGITKQQQRLEQALMTPDTERTSTTRQHYELAGEINAALDARRAADALRRRYPVAQGAGRWLVADDSPKYRTFPVTII
ncbi:hypothetical protein ACVXHA_12900 [Escherichia coli]